MTHNVGPFTDIHKVRFRPIVTASTLSLVWARRMAYARRKTSHGSAINLMCPGVVPHSHR